MTPTSVSSSPVLREGPRVRRVHAKIRAPRARGPGAGVVGCVESAPLERPDAGRLEETWRDRVKLGADLAIGLASIVIGANTGSPVGEVRAYPTRTEGSSAGSGRVAPVNGLRLRDPCTRW
jgi:hypothetical protein